MNTHLSIKTPTKRNVCSQAAARAFSSSERDSTANQLLCFMILPSWWRWMTLSVLTSLLSSVPCTFNTCPFLSTAAPACLCLLLSAHTRTSHPPTHPSHKSSSTPLPLYFHKNAPPPLPGPSSRFGVWVDKWRSKCGRQRSERLPMKVSDKPWRDTSLSVCLVLQHCFYSSLDLDPLGPFYTKSQPSHSQRPAAFVLLCTSLF